MPPLPTLPMKPLCFVLRRTRWACLLAVGTTIQPSISRRTLISSSTVRNNGSGGGGGYPPISLKKRFRYLSDDATSRRRQRQGPPPRTALLNKRDFDYSVDLVQNRDRESYLCGLLMPHEARKAYFAIRAFNVELASIKDGSVSRKVGGAQFAGHEGADASLALKVRMQWWRDALNQIYDGHVEGDDGAAAATAAAVAAVGDSSAASRTKKDDNTTSSESAESTFFDSMAASYFKNPVVRVLNHAVHDKQLTRRFLERLLEAREADLETKQSETLDEAVGYADETFSSLLYLSLETCNVRDEAADVVAQHAGIGIGLTTALRGTPFRLLQGECSIPLDVIPRQFPYHKLYSYFEDATSDSDAVDDPSPTAKLTDTERQMLKDAVQEVAALAYSHLSMARDLQGDVPRHARPCFLPVVPALHYLNQLERAEFDIFDDSLFIHPQQRHGNLTLLALLGRTWLTGVF